MRAGIGSLLTSWPVGLLACAGVVLAVWAVWVRVLRAMCGESNGAAAAVSAARPLLQRACVTGGRLSAADLVPSTRMVERGLEDCLGSVRGWLLRRDVRAVRDSYAGLLATTGDRSREGTPEEVWARRVKHANAGLDAAIRVLRREERRRFWLALITRG